MICGHCWGVEKEGSEVVRTANVDGIRERYILIVLPQKGLEVLQAIHVSWIFLESNSMTANESGGLGYHHLDFVKLLAPITMEGAVRNAMRKRRRMIGNTV